MDFGIKIKQKKAKIMASEVVFWAGITESDDEFHRIIVQYIDFCGKVWYNGKVGVRFLLQQDLNYFHLHAMFYIVGFGIDF